jgi:putative transferase (TIGR04331 family)
VEPLQVSEEYETRVADRFYSWGWNRDDRHVYPLSPPMLPAYAGRRRHRTLLICLDLPTVPYRLQLVPMPGTIEKMHDSTIDFLDALPNRKNLLIRPYPHDYGRGVVAKMRAKAPDAEFDTNQTTVFMRYAESRLVVFNYLGTGFLETLALNIPTVCFYNPETYLFREAAQPFIDSLLQVGIFHPSGQAAARFVAEIANDPEGWWAHPEVQDARRNFAQRYANFSPDWKEQWEQEFESALAQL